MCDQFGGNQPKRDVIFSASTGKALWVDFFFFFFFFSEKIIEMDCHLLALA